MASKKLTPTQAYQRVAVLLADLEQTLSFKSFYMDYGNLVKDAFSERAFREVVGAHYYTLVVKDGWSEEAYLSAVDFSARCGWKLTLELLRELMVVAAYGQDFESTIHEDMLNQGRHFARRILRRYWQNTLRSEYGPHNMEALHEIVASFFMVYCVREGRSVETVTAAVETLIAREAAFSRKNFNSLVGAVACLSP